MTSYGSTSRTKTVTKSYTGLSDADLTFIPKTVTENGVTCSLVDVNWVETSPYNPYDPDYGNRFNATAKYSGTYSSSYAKGYAYEVKYYGTVEKDEIEGYSCTLLFAPELRTATGTMCLLARMPIPSRCLEPSSFSASCSPARPLPSRL